MKINLELATEMDVIHPDKQGTIWVAYGKHHVWTFHYGDNYLLFYPTRIFVESKYDEHCMGQKWVYMIVSPEMLKSLICGEISLYKCLKQQKNVFLNEKRIPPQKLRHKYLPNKNSYRKSTLDVKLENKDSYAITLNYLYDKLKDF